MPDWSRYSNYNGEIITDTWHSVIPPTVAQVQQQSTVAQVQQQYEEYVREQEQQKCIMEQMLREEEERIKEMGKYPLFFWRETCKEKK